MRYRLIMQYDACFTGKRQPLHAPPLPAQSMRLTLTSSLREPPPGADEGVAFCKDLCAGLPPSWLRYEASLKGKDAETLFRSLMRQMKMQEILRNQTGCFSVESMTKSRSCCAGAMFHVEQFGRRGKNL